MKRQTQKVDYKYAKGAGGHISASERECNSWCGVVYQVAAG